MLVSGRIRVLSRAAAMAIAVQFALVAKAPCQTEPAKPEGAPPAATGVAPTGVAPAGTVPPETATKTPARKPNPAVPLDLDVIARKVARYPDNPYLLNEMGNQLLLR